MTFLFYFFRETSTPLKFKVARWSSSTTLDEAPRQPSPLSTPTIPTSGSGSRPNREVAKVSGSKVNSFTNNLTNVVWTYVTFKIRFVINHKLKIYLKECYLIILYQHFFFKYFLKIAFV